MNASDLLMYTWNVVRQWCHLGGGGLDLMTQLSVIKKLKSKEKWRLVTWATLKVILDFNKEKRYDEDVCLHFKITVESKK